MSNYDITSNENCSGTDNLIRISIMEKHLNIDDEIAMYIAMPPVDINFKDALLTSLYSQIEFLKTELEEKISLYVHYYYRRISLPIFSHSITNGQ